MKFSKPCEIATIERRYKRFLADITLKDQRQIVAHVPNTGSMQECWAPGQRVLLSYDPNPKRKHPYTLEMTHNGTTWINVNTGVTNRLAKEAIETGVIGELEAYENIKPEQKIGDSRIDFFLSNHPRLPDCYVEVKNVTLVRKNHASFPDAVSTRGQKHLEELIKIKAMGYRACMLYIVAREDALSFSPAHDIDPVYGELLIKAQEAGVEILCYQCRLSADEITVVSPLPVTL